MCMDIIGGYCSMVHVDWKYSQKKLINQKNDIDNKSKTRYSIGESELSLHMQIKINKQNLGKVIY